jgi:transcriptional regulator with XRE-family HTH domain
MENPNPITAHRADNGLSRDDLATKLGVNPSTLWRWETGDTLIPVEKLKEVERVTGIPRQKLRPDIFGEAA